MNNNKTLNELIDIGCTIINREDNTWDDRIRCSDCLEMPSWVKAWKCNKGLPIERQLKFRCSSFNNRNKSIVNIPNENFWE